MPDAPRSVGVVLFDGFELLDVTGPVDSLCRLPEFFTVSLLGPNAGPVRSAQGPLLVAEGSHHGAGPVDLVMVPGGNGTRSLAGDAAFLAWLAKWSSAASVVASVCTGAGLLAAAGLLDGYRATSNKLSFDWVVGQGPNVEWVPEARWVHDRDRWTSAGVTAGIDMTLALVAELCGEAYAARTARQLEYDWHRDAGWDPFAAAAGLVD